MTDAGANASKAKPFVIATEEAFATHEFIDAFAAMAAQSPSPANKYVAAFLNRPENRTRLADVDVRLADMDQNGVDMHLLSLTAPGVQVFEPELGTKLASRCNDTVAEWVAKYPKRFAALAAVAPQDPKAAAAEIDRAIGSLGLNGVIINSHTNGEFLDDKKFWTILEAAVRNKVAIYMHPTMPPSDMAKPMLPYSMQGAIWGFAAECGLHAMRMVLGGVFDEFPELQIVLGHGGEGLPYWLFRMDNVLENAGFAMRQSGNPVLCKRNPSEYVRENFHITTSGMFWDDLLQFGIKAMGIERIQFAIDYPYERTHVAMDWANRLPLSEADAALVLNGNARRVFHIRS